jgi:sugar phosphate isomerase/epimerase
MQIGLLITDLNQLEDAAAWGYEYAETVPQALGLDDPELRKRALAQIGRAPLPVLSLCGFIPDPQGQGLMVVGSEADLGRLRTFVRRVFTLMQEAGIGVIGYGSGGSRWVPEGFPRERALEQVREFLQLCGEEGEAHGVRVALEPYNRDDANLLNEVPEALEVVRQVGHSHAQLMADFFHMQLNGESLAVLEPAGPHLIHAHLAEPGRGRPQSTSAEHAAFIQALKRAGYEGLLTQTGPLPAYPTPAEAAAVLRRACQ